MKVKDSTAFPGGCLEQSRVLLHYSDARAQQRIIDSDRNNFILSP